MFPNAACVVSLIDRLIHHCEITGQCDCVREVHLAAQEEMEQEVDRLPGC